MTHYHITTRNARGQPTTRDYEALFCPRCRTALENFCTTGKWKATCTAAANPTGGDCPRCRACPTPP